VKFFSLFGVDLFAQVIHFDELDLVGIGHRRVNALAVYELAGFGMMLMVSSTRKESMTAPAAFG
jgi:hypothetical protein